MARSHAAWIALALLAGCAGSTSWVDEMVYGTRAVGPPQAAYAGVDRVQVHSEPDAGSPVEGVLTLHERVRRFQSEHGFAYVEAEGDIAGWVREQQLVAKRPRADKPAAAAPAPPAATEAPAPVEPSAEPAPAEPPPPVPDEKPTEPEPSVFDPY